MQCGWVAVGLVAWAAGGTACGGASPDGAVVRVAAAASLTEAFTDAARTFEDSHDGVRVALSFAASSAIAQQVNEDAPIDVVATADDVEMARIVDAGNASRPVRFARNRLAVVVERNNPKRLRDVADLGRDDVVLVACAPEVPCGRLAATFLAGAGLTRTPSSLEEHAKAVVAKVSLGEADAGLVYETDARAAAGTVEAVDVGPVPETDYLVAVTAQVGDAADAAEFVRFLTSSEGRRVLRRHGFLDARDASP